SSAVVRRNRGALLAHHRLLPRGRSARQRRPRLHTRCDRRGARRPPCRARADPRRLRRRVHGVLLEPPRGVSGPGRAGRYLWLGAPRSRAARTSHRAPARGPAVGRMGCALGPSADAHRARRRLRIDRGRRLREGYPDRPMLRLVLPKGSLERATLQLFEDADLAVVRSSEVDYRADIDDPRVTEVTILRPQEIPRYVADGLFALGVTGRDWIEETAADVVTITQLHYSKATARPFRIVVAVAGDSPYESVKDLPAGVRVQTEYPELTKRFFRDHGVEAEISLSYGATEAKIPEIADAVVDGTESGRALRAAGLKILDTVIVSYTELIANSAAYDDL